MCHPGGSSLSEDAIGELVRRDELSDWFNRRLFHPLARRLALALVPSPVTPNALSVSGGVCVVLAGLCYTMWGGLAGALVGFGWHLAWHVLDGADGDLARLTGKASAFGEAVDGIADYFSHIALYCMFGVMLAQNAGPGAGLLVVAAGISRIFQASHTEERRRAYEFWAYDRTWIRKDGLRPENSTERWMATLIGLYLSVSDRTRRGARVIDVLHQQALNGTIEMAAFRDAVRLHLGPLFGPLRLLGANQRTIALGVAVLMEQPIWYFAYELVILNVVLIWSMRAHARATERIERALQSAGTGQGPGDDAAAPVSTLP
jgi:phosphatidylglycerophosphate synthase